MKRDSDINESSKAEYLTKKTAKFTLPSDFPKEEEMFALLCKDIYEDLLYNAPDDIDSLGLWIEYDTITVDNAISLGTLETIQEYSKEDINPSYEFFKMTLID
jgi:hypothetical protein